MTLITLSEVAEVIMGQSPPGSTYNTIGSGLPFFQGKSEFGKVNPVAVKWCTEPTKIAEVGDILISVRAPVGPTNLADQKCCIGRGLAAIRPNPNSVDRDFVWFYLQYSQEELVKKGQGSTFEAINGDDLNDIELPNIDLNEQRQIAARLKAQLAEVETARQAAKVQLRDAALLRQRLLRQAFDALADGPHKVLGEWATTTSGSTPSRGDKRYWSPAEIPWVKTGEVAFAPITRTEEAISKQALAECSLTLLPPQTVLIAMYGQGKTRGQSAILEIEATTNQACFAILPNDTWDADFLHHWLMASYDDLRSLSDGRGGNQANLNGGLLNALEIPAPDIDDQQRIVARLKQQLAEADALRTALDQQLRDLDALPQRILALALEN
jgi:type I restriction enzyme S subunit